MAGMTGMMEPAAVEGTAAVSAAGAETRPEPKKSWPRGKSSRKPNMVEFG